MQSSAAHPTCPPNACAWSETTRAHMPARTHMRTRTCPSGENCSRSTSVDRFKNALLGASLTPCTGTFTPPPPPSGAACARSYRFTTPESDPVAKVCGRGEAARAVPLSVPSSICVCRHLRVRMSQVCTTPSVPAVQPGVRHGIGAWQGEWGAKQVSCASACWSKLSDTAEEAGISCAACSGALRAQVQWMGRGVVFGAVKAEGGV